MLLSNLLKGRIRLGRLTIVDGAGKQHVFGTEGADPDVAIRLHDKALHYKLFLNPVLYSGEAYMDGRLTIEKGTLGDLIDLYARNLSMAPDLPLHRFLARLSYLFRHFQHYNSVSKARHTVAPHYDASDGIANLFLDPDLQYTCAYFPSPDATLEQAQDAKKSHVAAKLMLEPGQRVMEFGSGWGGLALYLAQVADVDVTAVTISPKQHATALERVAAAGLSDRVHFVCGDFREQSGRYDRVVAIGLIEHLGVRHYPELFAKIRDMLVDDGVALIHGIGRVDGPGTTNAWTRKYIFPGGYLPALSEVLPVVERYGLIVTDIEILRLHYAETLKSWHDRFQANRDKVASQYDERFCRTFEFYLKGCEAAFRYWNQMVFQIQLAKRIDTVPLTRDYIEEWKRSHPSGGASA